MNDPWLNNWNLENQIKEKSYKNIPQANMLDLIMNLFSFVLLTYILTKFRYKFHPSTVIQKNVVSKKYCISAAINWQPMRGVTLSIPAKNTISSATKEEQRHRRILDVSFLRRLLKREIYIYKFNSYYTGDYYKGDSNHIMATTITISYVRLFV